MLDCCDSADNPLIMGEGFSIAANAKDKAMLGWQDKFLQCTSNEDWTESVWLLLKGGDTLRDAVFSATLLEKPWGKSASYFFGYLPVDIAPVIWGDGAMKLHGVYNGVGETATVSTSIGDTRIWTQSPDEEWFRPL